MTEITIDSETFDQGLNSISSQLNTQWEEKCDFYTTEFHNAWGSGNLACFDLLNGKGLITVDATFVSDIKVNLNYHNLKSPIKLIFNLGDSVNLRVDKHLHEIKNREFIFNVIRDNSKYEVALKKNTAIKFVVLFIEDGEFMNSILCDLTSSASEIPNLVAKGNNKVHTNQKLMNPQLIEAISNVLINNMDGIEKRLFLEGQFNTILSLMIEKTSSESEKSFQVYDVKLIEKAKSILDQEFTNAPTVKALAKKIGTNTNKLHGLFKEAYGTTINKYVLGKKMEMGRSLLLESKDSIGDISLRVGISNPSYFSKQFKRIYGLLPSEYRENQVSGIV